MTRVRTAPASPGRCLLVWAVATAAAVAVVGVLLNDLAGAADAVRRGAVDRHAFPVLLVWCSEAALVACACWWWVTATLVVRDAGSGCTRTRPGLPRPAARWLAAACGVAVLGSAGATAHATDAAPGPHAADTTGTGTGASLLAGLPLPQRASTATRVSLMLVRYAERPRVRSPHEEPRREQRVEVRPGDTLWALAQRTLPPGATDAAVARRWPEIHALNRAVIGPDPDLIQPGQRLRLSRP
jgi:nucleoid-associated protein YgaU